MADRPQVTEPPAWAVERIATLERLEGETPAPMWATVAATCVLVSCVILLVMIAT